MIRFLYLAIALFFSTTLQAQHTINQYKYVIVPEEYSFLDSSDQYQLNTMTKFFFTKHGFEAFVVGEQLPKELLSNGCMGLRAKVNKKSSMFITRLIVELVNCNEEVVFVSEEGTSSIKDYKRGYQEALRNAFASLETLNYKYEAHTPVETNAVPVVQNNKETVGDVVAPQVVLEEKQKDAIKTIASTTEVLRYLWNGKTILLHKKAFGYLVEQDNQGEIITLGSLYALSRTNHYLIATALVQGSAYFDSAQNMIIERISPETDVILKEVLNKQ